MPLPRSSSHSHGPPAPGNTRPDPLRFVDAVATPLRGHSKLRNLDVGRRASGRARRARAAGAGVAATVSWSAPRRCIVGRRKVAGRTDVYHRPRRRGSRIGLLTPAFGCPPEGFWAGLFSVELDRDNHCAFFAGWVSPTTVERRCCWMGMPPLSNGIFYMRYYLREKKNIYTAREASRAPETRLFR